MKIVDEKEKTIPFSALSCGDVCKVIEDGIILYLMKIVPFRDCNGDLMNAVDVAEGEVLTVAESLSVIALSVEMTVL
jgi:hypothetical protein